MRLNNKVILVTGAASGIGAGIARRCAAEGATVWVADVDSTGGPAVADSIGGHYVALDVANESAWTEALATVVAQSGRLDALINNAGIVSNQSIDMVDMASWQRVLGVNLTGPMLGCRAAIAQMRAQGSGGSIINVASTVSLLGLAYDVIYTTSKTALLGLTRSAAAHCARSGWNIRVNTLHPGTTDTAILRGHIAADPTMEARFNAMSPMGRMAQPDEIAALAVFLASDESSYCTGGAFIADGGLTAMHPVM